MFRFSSSNRGAQSQKFSKSSYFLFVSWNLVASHQGMWPTYWDTPCLILSLYYYKPCSYHGRSLGESLERKDILCEKWNLWSANCSNFLHSPGFRPFRTQENPYAQSCLVKLAYFFIRGKCLASNDASNLFGLWSLNDFPSWTHEMASPWLVSSAICRRWKSCCGKEKIAGSNGVSTCLKFSIDAVRDIFRPKGNSWRWGIAWIFMLVYVLLWFAVVCSCLLWFVVLGYFSKKCLVKILLTGI